VISARLSSDRVKPFDKAQGKPFDKAQGKPFDKAQGKQGKSIRQLFDN